MASRRWHSSKGLRPWTRQVPKSDASVIVVVVPAAERVPPLILRATTRWRGLRSAALLVAGTVGSATKTKSPARCFAIRWQRVRCGGGAPAAAVPIAGAVGR